MHTADFERSTAWKVSFAFVVRNETIVYICVSQIKTE